MSIRKNVNRKLSAGTPGTKKMVEQYGEKLLCVRYRYDIEKKIKYKTVEIIVDKGFWDSDARLEKGKRKVEIRVGFNEIETRTKVKDAGGIWNREKKVWVIDYGVVKELGLGDRIVKEKD